MNSGFTTGSVLVDWTSRLSRPVGRLIPFVWSSELDGETDGLAAWLRAGPEAVPPADTDAALLASWLGGGDAADGGGLPPAARGPEGPDLEGASSPAFDPAAPGSTAPGATTEGAAGEGRAAAQGFTVADEEIEGEADVS